MKPHPDDELALGPAGDGATRQRGVWDARGLSAAKVALPAGTAGVLLLLLAGLEPAALTIPLLLAGISLLLGATSASLFAWIACLQVAGADSDADDEGGGPGDEPDERPEPPSGGNLEFDWHLFERDFRSYCERATPVLA